MKLTELLPFYIEDGPCFAIILPGIGTTPCVTISDRDQCIAALVPETKLHGKNIQLDIARGLVHAANVLPECVAALKDAFAQFEHNGDESDSDREVLNAMQAALAQSENIEI